VATERGQAEGSTVEGILGEGTSTRATGCFVCVGIIVSIMNPI
jgi:hypothetical protein